MDRVRSFYSETDQGKQHDDSTNLEKADRAGHGGAWPPGSHHDQTSPRRLRLWRVFKS